MSEKSFSGTINSGVARARKKTRTKVFNSDEFVDVDLHDTPPPPPPPINSVTTSALGSKLFSKELDHRHSTHGRSTTINSWSDSIAAIKSSPENATSGLQPNRRQVKSDLADQLVVQKITSDKELYRRAKSNINVSSLSSYNYRGVAADSETKQIAANHPQPTLTPITENVPADGDTSSQQSITTTNRSNLDRSSKLEAEIKADLISKIGAIGLPMNDRPAGLPPKPKKELEHQKKLYSELIRMNQKKIDKQTKSILKQTIARDSKEQQLNVNSDFWHALADCAKFDELVSKASISKKISNGMPSYIRGKIWKRFSQHKISIAEEVFDRMFNDQSTSQSTLDSCDDTTNQIRESIEFDVDRTLNNLKLFQRGHPMHEDLCKLLYVFHCYNSNVGYAQGMSYAMSVFLLNLQPFDCFVCFNNLINEPVFSTLYRCDVEKLDEIYNFFETILSLENERLATHIQHISLNPSMYLLDWLMSAFCKVFSLEVVSTIFDNYFIEGPLFFFKCAIMILGHHTKMILSSNDPIYCAQMLTKPITNLQEEALLKRVRKIDDYTFLYNQLEMFLKFN